MKQTRLIISLLPAMIVTSIVCAQEQQQVVKQAIEKSNQVYGEAFIKGDSTLFIDRYTRDAWIMNPGAPSLKGATAAATFYTIAYHQMQIRNVILKTGEVVACGDFASETGTFELRDSRNAVLDKGKYLVLWKRTGSGWKMHRDSFNSDGPLSSH